MKKLLYLIVLVVPMLVIGQTTTENYIKTTTYKSEYKNYGTGTTSIIADELLDNNANFSIINQLGGHVSLANGTMTIEILGGWATGYTLKTGLIKDLHASFDIPDTELGALLTDSGNPTGFYAEIVNNRLMFSSPYVIQAIDDMTLTANLPPEYDDAFSVSFNNTIFNCDDNYGTYSSLGTITVNNGVLSFSLLAQSNSSCFLKLGQIYQLQIDVPDVELGSIPYENGDASPYKVKIENNWLVFYTDQVIPSYTNDLDFSFTLNLPHASISDNDKIESITYFDGLGRTMQKISSKAGGQGEDVIIPFAYDAFGRQTKEYLPYVDLEQPANTTSLNYRDNTTIFNDQPVYYLNKYADDFSDPNAVNAYNESVLELSPLNRLLKQGAPGTAWSVNATNDDHTVKYEYHANTYSDTDITKDNVKYFLVDNSNGYIDIQLQDNGFYAAGELSKRIIKDENWQPNQPAPKEKDHTIEEFTNRTGQTVLKRNYNNGERHDTYYIYDDFGNLTYVLPPLVNALDGVSSNELTQLSYQYKYDHRNRLIEKKIPGKGWEYIVYDALDRPVFTQDANLRGPHKWMFNKYDMHGRIVYTGLYTGAGSTRQSMQNSIDNSAIIYEKRVTSVQTVNGTAIYYSNNVFPNNNIDILTVNYYDDYNIGSQITLNPANGSWPWEGMEISLETKGLLTVSRVRVLGTNHWITTATYYDDKGRPWESHVKNDFLNTQDWELNKLDFTGNIEKTIASHIKGSSHVTITNNYTYDHVNRLLTHKQKIGSQAEEVLVSNTYDELGQLVTKGVGGKTTQNRLQDVEYKYNVRGWLTHINNPLSLGNDLFSFQLNYNTTALGGTNSPLFNGNISETIWKTANDVSNTAQVTRGYAYEYDALNRIKKGDYAYKHNTGAYNFTSNASKYEMGVGAYDRNGNILSLNREVSKTGYQVEDQYVYNYLGNQLTNITLTDSYNFEETRDYTYDNNGNLIYEYREYDGGSNGEEEREINYNHLNLPTAITIFKEGTDPYGDQGNQIQIDGSITYVYDATGAKLRKLVDDGNNTTITDYAGNYIYEDNVLQFFNHTEGYVKPVFVNGSTTISSFEYIYQYKDHLNNIRLSYSDVDDNGVVDSSEIIEENNYYPFGLKHKGYNNIINGIDHKYGFGGKEEQDELGLNWVDITARNYDAALGRWMNIDPLAEKMRRHSPYNFAFNNPIYWQDYDGMSPRGPEDPPKERIFSNGITVSFNYDDKGKTQGTDTITQSVVSSETIHDANGRVFQIIEKTVMTTTYVNADGEVVDAKGNKGNATQTTYASIKSRREDGVGFDSSEPIAYSTSVNIDESSMIRDEFKETVQNLEDYKKSEKISPIQAIGRERENISRLEGGVSFVLGVVSMIAPEPAASKAFGVASIATGFDALVRTTDPEKIRIRLSFTKK